LLLLDEPFSAVDAPLRARLRHEFLQLQQEFDTTTILVTHDPTEAILLADELLLLDAGRVLDARLDLRRAPSGNVSRYTPIKKQSDIRFATSIASRQFGVSKGSPVVLGQARKGGRTSPSVMPPTLWSGVERPWISGRGDNSPNTCQNDRITRSMTGGESSVGNDADLRRVSSGNVSRWGPSGQSGALSARHDDRRKPLDSPNMPSFLWSGIWKRFHMSLRTPRISRGGTRAAATDRLAPLLSARWSGAL
jgi:energy-coupling factor transporter ATP-binding protein EcfA2